MNSLQLPTLTLHRALSALDVLRTEGLDLDLSDASASVELVDDWYLVRYRWPEFSMRVEFDSVINAFLHAINSVRH